MSKNSTLGLAAYQIMHVLNAKECDTGTLLKTQTIEMQHNSVNEILGQYAPVLCYITFDYHI